MKASDWVQQIALATVRHTTWRRECLNLVASENTVSPAVAAALSTDLVGRYGDYVGRDLTARKYLGNRYIVDLEQSVNELARQLFRASSVELRPLSGHVAGIGVVLALTKPGDVVLELSGDAGGHRLVTKLLQGTDVPLQVEFLSFDAEAHNIDVAAVREQIRRLRPRIVILGASQFLFPHPIHAIADALHSNSNGTLIYDASHVLGLIVGGEFQKPLDEGADVVFGSTHKTFPGPQGGIIFSDSEEMMDRISQAVYPGLVTNHHIARIAALGVSMAEMDRWGRDYANQTVQNARRLAAELVRKGVPVVGSSGRHTDSHTVLIPCKQFGKAADLGQALEKAGIIVTTAKLMPQRGVEGLRIGVQEVTRWGATGESMHSVAGLVTAVLAEPAAAKRVGEHVREFVQDTCTTLKFCLEESDVK